MNTETRTVELTIEQIKLLIGRMEIELEWGLDDEEYNKDCETIRDILVKVL